MKIQSSPVLPEESKSSFSIGTCTWVIDRSCPDENIKFYLYTRSNPDDRQMVHIDETWENSNLSMSNFNPKHAVKIIIHGYNSDMFLTPLIDMKTGTFCFLLYYFILNLHDYCRIFAER